MSLSGSLMNYSVVAPELKAMDISGKVRDRGSVFVILLPVAEKTLCYR